MQTRRDGSIRIPSTSSNNSEVDTAVRMLRTRTHPKKTGTVCGMFTKGGCTRAFDSIAELAEFIVDSYL